MEERKGSRQRKLGKGPATPVLERLTELIRLSESQTIPFQLHGNSSRAFQEERAPNGSSSPSLALRR